MTIEMYEDVMKHLQIDKYRELIIKQDQKITELEKACDETQKLLDKQIEATYKLDKENAELRKVAEFQQSNNMDTHLENKKLKEGLAVGETFNKALNSMNKTLEEERDKYRDMVFDLQQENKVLAQNLEDTEIVNKALEKENAELKDYRLTTLAKQQTGMSKYALNLEHKLSWYDDQLTKAKEIIKEFVHHYKAKTIYIENMKNLLEQAEQFLKEIK